MEKSKSEAKISDLNVSTPKKTKDTSANLLELVNEEQALLKRINSSSQNISSTIENHFHAQKKKSNQKFNFMSPLNTDEADDLLISSINIETEYKKLLKDHKQLSLKFSELEDDMEKLRISKNKELKDFGEKLLDRLENLEKEIQKVKLEKKVAVDQLVQLEERLDTKSVECEKVKAHSKDELEKEKKKLEKTNAKFQNSMELVENLLKQKKQLTAKIDEANNRLEELKLASSREVEKVLITSKLDNLENLIMEVDEPKTQTKKSKKPKHSKSKNK